MVTYPNQKIIHINKKTSSDFLQIDKDAWMKASKELNYGTFRVYLYLAGNQDNFDLALSPVAVKEKVGISKNTYHRAITELQEKKYLFLKQGNIFDFYIYPQEGIYPQMGTLPTHTRVHDIPTDGYVTYSPMGTEIDKRDKRDIFYISESEQSSSSKEKKRYLKDMSNEELKELKRDFEQEVKYSELYKKYGICKGQLDKTLSSRIDDIIDKREKEEIINKHLTEEIKQQLIELLNVKEDELMNYITAVNLLPEEIVLFLNDHSIFTYKVWIDEYADQEDYADTYFEWFVSGVDANFCDKYKRIL